MSVPALLCLQLLLGKPLFLTLYVCALKHLQLANNEFAFSLSPPDPRSKHCLLSKNIYSRGTWLLLLILFGSLPEVKLGPQKRSRALTFVYVDAVETVL